jgi:hypothetical protein
MSLRSISVMYHQEDAALVDTFKLGEEYNGAGAIQQLRGFFSKDEPVLIVLVDAEDGRRFVREYPRQILCGPIRKELLP